MKYLSTVNDREGERERETERVIFAFVKSPVGGHSKVLLGENRADENKIIGRTGIDDDFRRMAGHDFNVISREMIHRVSRYAENCPEQFQNSIS